MIHIWRFFYDYCGDDIRHFMGKENHASLNNMIISHHIFEWTVLLHP